MSEPTEVITGPAADAFVEGVAARIESALADGTARRMTDEECRRDGLPTHAETLTMRPGDIGKYFPAAPPGESPA